MAICGRSTVVSVVLSHEVMKTPVSLQLVSHPAPTPFIFDRALLDKMGQELLLKSYDYFNDI